MSERFVPGTDIRIDENDRAVDIEGKPVQSEKLKSMIKKLHENFEVVQNKQGNTFLRRKT